MNASGSSSDKISLVETKSIIETCIKVAIREYKSNKKKSASLQNLEAIAADIGWNFSFIAVTLLLSLETSVDSKSIKVLLLNQLRKSQNLQEYTKGFKTNEDFDKAAIECFKAMEPSVAWDNFLLQLNQLNYVGRGFNSQSEEFKHALVLLETSKTTPDAQVLANAGDVKTAANLQKEKWIPHYNPDFLLYRSQMKIRCRGIADL